MADASFFQTSFLGGEWSPLVQGRMADPTYRTGMNVCRNGLPIEENSWVRRPGTRLLAATRKGALGVLRAFDFSSNAPYLIELTAGHMRFLAGTSLVIDTSTTQLVTAISNASPAVIETEAAHGLTTGDEVLAVQDPSDTVPNFTLAPIFGRELEVTVIDTTHFSVKDPVTGANVAGTNIALGTSLVNVSRVFDLTVPYAAADLALVNTVQDNSNLLLLHPSYPPEAINATSQPTVNAPAVFTVGAAAFKDGPYFDPPTDGTTATPSGTSGSVTVTLAGGSTRFTPSTDVGRMIRLFSEPAAWAIGTAYTAGQSVKYNNAYFTALVANTGKQPDIDLINWGVATGAAQWNWGTITAVADATHATVTLSPVTVGGITGTNLVNTSACTTWRLGLYSATTGYPGCGTYHEGRLWLSGAQKNRIDGSASNDFFNFAPTYGDGTLADNNGIAAVFNSGKLNTIFWMQADSQGILCGTQGGEWLVQASAQNDPLTPTSIQAHVKSTYGCANIPAHRASLPIVFVQRYTKKVLEYITTDFRGMVAKNISMTGKHLTQKGIAELAYQREKVPVLWARTTDGTLLSCTYKRESPWASDPPDFQGWAAHSLPGLTLNSIQVGPSFDGATDALSVVAKRTSDGFYYTMLLTDMFDVDWTIQDAMFVDFGTTPAMYQIITTTNPHVIRFYSLWRLAGQNVDVMVGGVDVGTLLVAADGTLDVPIDNGGLLTTALISGLSTTTNFHGLGLTIQTAPAGTVTIPASTGILEFDTSLGGDGNGVSIPDWDGATGLGKPVLFTSSASTGACALWDLTATNTPPTRLAFHATNAVQGISVGCVDSAGNFYLQSFQPKIIKLDKTLQTQQITDFTGIIATANNWIVVTIAGKDYIVQSGGTEVSLIDISGAAPSFVVKNNTFLTEMTTGYLGRFRVAGSKLAELWCIGQPTTSGGAFTRQAQNLGLYKVIILPGAITPVTCKRELSITPAMFGWTHISGNVDILGDETDGNPIIWAQSSVLGAWASTTTYNQYDCVTNAGHDFESLAGGNLNNTPTVGGTASWRDLGVHQAVAEQNAIKVNVQTGAVMWTVKMVGGLLGYRQMTRVRYGKLRLLDVAAISSSNHSLWDIDTINATGTLAATTLIWNVAPDAAKQFYNDKTGQWIAGVGYGFLNGQPGSPSPIGATATTFNTWGELGPAAGFAYPLVPAPNAATFATAPAAIGYSYASQAQILRPIVPQETGAQNGPALGKTRRNQQYAALLNLTQGVSFGTVFGQTRPAQLRDKNESALPLTTLFSGVHWDALEDDNTYDGMLCWEISRPYPVNVCAVEPFLHTQDR